MIGLGTWEQWEHGTSNAYGITVCGVPAKKRAMGTTGTNNPLDLLAALGDAGEKEAEA